MAMTDPVRIEDVVHVTKSYERWLGVGRSGCDIEFMIHAHRAVISRIPGVRDGEFAWKMFDHVTCIRCLGTLS